MRPFLAVMEKERGRFQFPAVGIRMVGVEHLAALVRGFNAGGAMPSFTKIVVEQLIPPLPNAGAVYQSIVVLNTAPLLNADGVTPFSYTFTALGGN